MSSTKPFFTDEQRWQAVLDRDPQAEDRFLYSVKTTGIFCRVTCGARLPLRENVAFHPSTAAARSAGFRPCRRCKPEGEPLSAEWSEVVAKACRTIEESTVAPSNSALAAAAAMSSSHFQRVFKQATGMTPKVYARSVRSARVREELHRESSITEAAYNAGFRSSSRFYAGSTEVLGMTPTSYRQGGGGLVIRFGVGECSLGSILAAATERGICAIFMGDDPEALARQLQSRFPNADIIGGEQEFERWMAEVISLVESPRAGIHLPLDVRGTVFQHQVWQALRDIPAGSTATYSEIAQRIGKPTAARAVAAACAANNLAVAIPCHRVVRADQTISGYRWGVERKIQLLGREADSE